MLPMYSRASVKLIAAGLRQPVRGFAAPGTSSAGAAAAERTFARDQASMNELYMRAVEPKPPAR